jgi:hypothetical protein
MIETIIHPPKQIALSLQEVRAATSWIENMTRRALINQRRKATFYLQHNSNTPLSSQKNSVFLPTQPLQEMKRVLFQGNPVDLYQIIDNRYVLLPSIDAPGELILVYEVGYGTQPEDVPSPLKQAILLAVVKFYEDMVFPQEREVSSLITPYRPLSIH